MGPKSASEGSTEKKMSDDMKIMKDFYHMQRSKQTKIGDKP